MLFISQFCLLLISVTTLANSSVEAAHHKRNDVKTSEEDDYKDVELPKELYCMKKFAKKKKWKSIKEVGQDYSEGSKFRNKRKAKKFRERDHRRRKERGQDYQELSSDAASPIVKAMEKIFVKIVTGKK